MKKRSETKGPKQQRKAAQKARVAQARAAVEQVLERKSEPQSAVLELSGDELLPVLEGYDEASLAHAKAHWFFGDWAALAALDLKTLRNHPERDRFALLAASAHQQLGDHDKARDFTRLALNWGCPSRLVAQILVAGVHNSLGRVSALRQDEVRTTRHFQAAVAASDHRDHALASHARSVREMTRLNLLPQAASLLGELNNKSEGGNLRPEHAAAHVKVLGMEVDWLRERIVYLQKTQNTTTSSTVLGAAKSPSSKSEASGSSGMPDVKKYHGLHGLDRKLEAYVDYDNGYYVELGANDGVNQSNTVYLERERRWKGVLIEPILHNYLKCKKNRSEQNRFYCAACVSFDYAHPHVALTYANLMTAPSGLESDIEDPVGHAHSGRIYMAEGEEPVEVMASAKTLNAILDDADAPNTIDLLSLDVEGAEIEVLKGIDHSRFRFKYMLIESREPEKLAELLEGVNYILVDKLSHHDYLFSLK